MNTELKTIDERTVPDPKQALETASLLLLTLARTESATNVRAPSLELELNFNRDFYGTLGDRIYEETLPTAHTVYHHLLDETRQQELKCHINKGSDSFLGLENRELIEEIAIGEFNPRILSLSEMYGASALFNWTAYLAFNPSPPSLGERVMDALPQRVQTFLGK